MKTILESSTEKQRAFAVVRKIGTQRPAGNHANLIFAVFKQAVHDFYNRTGFSQTDHAILYLKKPVVRELEILGIDTEWARTLFKKANTRAMQ